MEDERLEQLIDLSITDEYHAGVNQTDILDPSIARIYFEFTYSNLLNMCPAMKELDENGYRNKIIESTFRGWQQGISQTLFLLNHKDLDQHMTLITPTYKQRLQNILTNIKKLLRQPDNYSETRLGENTSLICKNLTKGKLSKKVFYLKHKDGDLIGISMSAKENSPLYNKIFSDIFPEEFQEKPQDDLNYVNITPNNK